MASLGDLVVNLVAKSDRFTKGMNQARGSLGSLTSSVVTMSAKTAAGFAAAGAATAAMSLPLIKMAAEAEQTEVAFGTLLGSAERAQTLLGQLEGFAASTPFESGEINAAARSLLAFGSSAGEVTGELRMIGDIAAGVGVPLGELSEIYGKARTSGRLFAEDVNQLTGRGIPIISALADQFGVADSEVKKLVESGKVGFPEMQAAFASMTSEGGQFSGMMEAQSGTLMGLWSTLTDNMKLAGKDIGKTLIEAFDLKDGVAGVIEFAQNVRSHLESLKPFIMQFANNVQTYFAIFRDAAVSAFEAVRGLLGSAGVSFDGFGDAVLDAMIGVEFAMKNWQDIGTLALSTIALKLVELGGEFTHIFTGVIPSLLSYVANNWQKMFHDMGELALTVMQNLAKNIVKVLKNIPKMIKGQVNFADLWTPLVEGAEFQLSKMPDIPPRVMGDLEKELRRGVDAMSENIGMDFEQFRQERLAQLSPVQAQAAAKREQVDEIERRTKPAGVVEDKKDDSKLRGLEAKSQEAFDVMLANVGKGDKSKTPEKQLKQLEKIAKGIDSLNKKSTSTIQEKGFD